MVWKKNNIVGHVLLKNLLSQCSMFFHHPILWHKHKIVMTVISTFLTLNNFSISQECMESYYWRLWLIFLTRASCNSSISTRLCGYIVATSLEVPWILAKTVRGTIVVCIPLLCWRPKPESVVLEKKGHYNVLLTPSLHKLLLHTGNRCLSRKWHTCTWGS
jgi:hypothetical protein